MRFHTRIGTLLLGLLIALSATTQAAEQPAKKSGQTLVVRVSSLDNLIASAKYLVEEAGKEELANQVEGLLKQFTGPKGLEGIDTTKPFGLYARLTPNVVDSPWGVLVPIADEKTFFDMLERVGVKREKQDDGSFKVDVPGSPIPAFARLTNNYLYVTIGGTEKVAANVLPKPESLFGPKETGVASLTVNLDQVPQALRDLVLGQASMRLADFKEKKVPNETAAQRSLRLATLDQGLVYLKTILNEGKSIRAGLDVDPKSNQLAVTLALKAQAGSGLADTIASLGKMRSMGSALIGGDSAMNMMLSAAVPEKLRPLLMKVIDEGVKRIPLDKLDDTQKELAEKGIKALMPTLKMAEIDGGVAIRGPGAKGLYTLVMGLKIKEGTEIEKAIKEAIKKAPAEVQQAITIDAAKDGGVSIHKVQPDNVDANTRETLGDGPIYFAVRDDALLVAMGSNALDAIKEAVTAEPKTGNLALLEMAMARFAPLMKRDNKQAPEAAKKAFGKKKDDDKLTFTLEGGESLRLRMVMKSGLIRFFTLMEEMKKKDL